MCKVGNEILVVSWGGIEVAKTDFAQHESIQPLVLVSRIIPHVGTSIVVITEVIVCRNCKDNWLITPTANAQVRQARNKALVSIIVKT